MNAAYGIIRNVIEAATTPLGAVGLALQSQNLTPAGADAQRIYDALLPFQNLFQQWGPVRVPPQQPLAWSAASTPPATPNDISALLGRISAMFPDGLPAAGAPAQPQAAATAASSGALGQLSGLFDSAQQLLLSNNPTDQLQGQQQLQQYQTLMTLFSTLLSISYSVQKMLVENARV